MGYVASTGRAFVTVSERVTLRVQAFVTVSERVTLRVQAELRTRVEHTCTACRDSL